MINIGQRVLASMDKETWYSGVFVESSDTFAQYGVLRDDIGEVRFFIYIDLGKHND